jgi:putative endonuclease
VLPIACASWVASETARLAVSDPSVPTTIDSYMQAQTKPLAARSAPRFVTDSPFPCRHVRARRPYGRAMTEARQLLGREGERIVAREVERRGWRVIAKNARVKGIRGELDLVALDAGTLVVIEVKTGRAGAQSGPASMLEMVGPRKQRQLRRLASAWLHANRAGLPAVREVRIDVVGLRLDAAGRIVEWDHVRAAC